MDGFEGDAFLVLRARVVSCGLLLLSDLKLSVVQSGASNGVTQESDSTAQITLEASHVEVGVLAVDFAVDATSHRFDLFGELGLRGGGSAPEEHLREHVGGSSGLKSVLAGSGSNVDSNAGG